MGIQRLLYAVSLSACATAGGVGSEEPAAPHARVQLAPLVADDTVRLVPHAAQPMLPSADRISRVIAARLGEEATVDVRYCVAPTGRVVSAALERGSTLAAFDHAVMTDIVAWQFGSRPGPEGLQTCQAATIVYRPRS